MNIYFFWDNLTNLPNPYKNNYHVAQAIHQNDNVIIIDSDLALQIACDFEKETGIKISIEDIIIPAAKSDVIRLMALYLNGGWYLDLDLQVKRNLSYLSKDKEFVLFNRKDKFDGYWLTNMAFYFKERHPLLLDILRFIEHCFKNKVLMYDVWSCTGPGALTAFINNHEINDSNTLPFDTFFTGTGRVFRSIDSSTGSSWKYQQAFGIITGSKYNQYAMPKDPNNCNRLIGFLIAQGDIALISCLESHGHIFVENLQFKNFLKQQRDATSNEILKDLINITLKIE